MTYLGRAARAVQRRRRLRASARGASAVEYALLLAGIALIIVVAVGVFGGAVRGLFETVCDPGSGTTSTDC